MELRLFQIDAFSDKVFHGNPAAVCPLDEWLSDTVMQAIAAENNLAETAFFVAKNGNFDIRWFTPSTEVKLCGHATLASAYVLFNELNYAGDIIHFDSLSGPLYVSRKADWIELDFPLQKPQACDTPQAILDAFSTPPLKTLRAEDYIVVFASETDIYDAKPDLNQLKKLDLRAVCITSQSSKVDFINRVFAPNCGINEDPVTGSVYTQLAPYWAEQLNKNQFTAMQVSQRGGFVKCEINKDRVKIAGQARKYLQGTIII